MEEPMVPPCAPALSWSHGRGRTPAPAGTRPAPPAPAWCMDFWSPRLASRRRSDRLDDVHVAGAAADVSLDGAPDLVLGRFGVRVEEVLRTHQHPGRAVAALERVVGAEGLLQRAQLA